MENVSAIPFTTILDMRLDLKTLLTTSQFFRPWNSEVRSLLSLQSIMILRRKSQWHNHISSCQAAAAKSLQSCPTLCDPTEAHHTPLSLGFSRQEHWSGLPFPSPMHENEKWKWSHWVVSISQRPHALQPTRLLRPWDFPGRSTGVGCHWRPQFDSWVGKILWRRDRLPTPVFWPREFHGLYGPWGHKELDTTERLSLLLYTKLHTDKTV